MYFVNNLNGGYANTYRTTLVAVAVLATGALTPAAVAAQSPASSAEPRLVDSAALATPAVAAGHLVTASGAPAAGKPVLLMAWPDNDVTDNLEVGDRVNLQPIAQATTTDTGAFTLRLPNNKVLAPFAGADHLVNFEVVADAGDQVGAYSFSRSYLGDGAYAQAPLLREPGDLPAQQGVAAAVTPAAAAAAALTQAPAAQMRVQLQTAGTDADAEQPGSVATTEPVVQKGCTTTLVKNFGNKRGLVGQNYSTASYVWADFVYSAGASSTLGVGWSANGKFGTWKQSGTMSKSSHDYEGFSKTWGKRSAYRFTWFKYGKYHLQCTYGAGYSSWYETRTTSWAGGAESLDVSAVPAGHCVPQEAGSAFTKHTTTAVKWTNGADLSGTIGIDLSIRTGYSDAAKVHFHFNRHRRLCGTGDVPAGHPYQLRAKMPA